MSTFQSDLDFYDTKISTLRGQLNPATAKFSMFALHAQNAAGITGNLLEIGVLGGRYTALMQRMSQPEQNIYGIDPFYLEGTSPEKVMADLTAIGCNDRVEILKDRSAQIGKDGFKEKFGKLRLFHIDGSHQRDDVIVDLELAESMLNADTIVAFDDFLNPYWMGCTEALFYYFERTKNSNMVPFMYCRNKLFLCHKNKVGFYENMASDFVAAHGASLKITGKPDRTTKIMDREIRALQ